MTSSRAQRRNRRVTRVAAAVTIASLAVFGGTVPAFAIERGERAAAAATTNPVVPTGLKVEAGNGKLYVSWSANTDNTSSYSVQLGTGTPVSVPAGTQTTTFSGLTNGTSYNVRISAQYPEGSVSAWSAPVAGTPANTQKPAQPVGLTASKEDTKVTLTWSAGPADGRFKYTIRRDGAVVKDNIAATDTSWIDTGVVNYTSYSYTITAYAMGGLLNLESIASDPSAPAIGTPVDLTAPAAPRNLAVSNAFDTRATLTWTANTEIDLKSYLVMTGDVVVATVPKGTTTVTLTGLTNGQTTNYYLTAIDVNGNVSVPTASVAVTPVDRTPPDTPANLALGAGDGYLDASWSAPNADDVAMYRLYVNGATTPTAMANVGTTVRRLTGLTNGTAYTVRISAVDRAGNESPQSGPVSGTPRDLTPPAAPTGVMGTSADSRATLTWNANSEPDLANYLVLNSAGATVTTVGKGSTTAMLTGLTNGTTYTYSVVAVDTAGNISARSTAVVVIPLDQTPPAVPVGVTAVAGDTTATLSWNPVADADLASYRIIDAQGALIATVPKGTTTRTITGLTNASTYEYRVIAVDTAGNASAPSVAASVTPRDTTPPAVPTGVTGTAGDSAASVRWNAVGDADLARYEVVDKNGVVVRTITKGTETAQFTGLTNGTPYEYRVVAVDTVGNRSAPSAAVTLTPRDTTPPAAPVGVSAVPGNGSVTLSWTANTEPDLASYRVVDDRDATVATVTAPGRTTTVIGLTSGTSYRYRVVALDTTGNVSSPSAEVVATPADTVPPAAPTGLAAQAGDTRVTLTWSANTETDLDHYNVYDVSTGRSVASVAKGSQTSSISGLVNDTAYRYRITAVDTAGNESTPGGTVTVTPTDTTAPAAPVGVAALAGDGRITLTWTPNAESDLDRYVVLEDGNVVARVDKPATTAVVSGLTNGTTYTYRIAAVDGHGNASLPSSPVSAVPSDQTAPSTPTGVTATPGDTRATVTWDAVPDTDLHHYLVVDERGRELGTVPAGTTTLTFTGLRNGTAYNAAVIAVDTAGNRSAPSALVTTTPQDTTAPGVPTGLIASPGDSRALLSWDAVSDDDLANYVIHDVATGRVVATSAGRATSVWVMGLTNGTPSTFTVSAVDRDGNTSARSASVTVTPKDTTPPAVVTAVVATAGDTTATVTWTASADPDVAYYDVVDEGGFPLVRATAPATTATVRNLVNDVARTFAVIAVDTTGNRSAAVAANVVTPVDRTAPAVPQGVTALAGDSRITLTWNGVADTDLDHYVVVDASDVEVATVNRASTTVVLTELTNGTAYSYRVRAVDVARNASASSSAVTATPKDSTPPAVPVNLAATPGDTSASFTWDAVVDADVASYVLLDGSGTVLGSATAPATSATLTGLVNGRPYAVSVAAVDRDGNRSAPSAPVTVTPVDASPPSAPTGLTGLPGDRSVSLTWTPVPDADLDHYEVRTPDGTLVTTSAKGTSFVKVSGLTNGTPVTYVLVAVDASGNTGPASNAVTVTPGDDLAPSAPSGVGSVAGDSEVTVTWTASTDPDVDHYEIRDQAGLTRATAPKGATSAVVRGLTNGQTYTFTVRAVDAAGNASPPVAVPPATPRDQTGPGAPAGLTAVGGDRQVTLTWTPVADGDLAGYEVLDAGGQVVATMGASVTTATITGLTNGTAVTYSVRAVDVDGNPSTASASATATPTAAALAAPTDLDGTSASGAVSLTWSPVAGATGYEVVNGTTVTPVTGTTATVGGLTDGTSYSFAVRAVAADGRVGLLSTSVTVAPRSPATTPLAAGAGTGSGTAVTRNGRYAVFGTAASLEPSDTNTDYELYVRDAKSGLVSRLAPGAGAADASQVALSEDGRYVALTTSARLLPSDTNSLPDVYRLDRTTGTWTLVSAQPGQGTSATVKGTEITTGATNVFSGPSVAMTSDGRYVFFFSKRADLVAGDSADTMDLFRKDLTTGSIDKVSASSATSGSAGEVMAPALAVTPDGRYVVYVTRLATYPVVVRKDMSTGQMAVVSGLGTWTSPGTLYFTQYDAHDVSVSDDGRYVGFSTNSAPFKVAGSFVAVRRDMNATGTGAFTRVSSTVKSNSSFVRQVTVDPSGRYVFFQTKGSELPEDTLLYVDWYRYDTTTGVLVVVTNAAGGTRPKQVTSSDDKDWGSLQTLTGDTVLVTTYQGLMTTDTNAKGDVYRKDLATGAVSLPLQ